jgi:hypothetical protein
MSMIQAQDEVVSEDTWQDQDIYDYEEDYFS